MASVFLVLVFGWQAPVRADAPVCRDLNGVHSGSSRTDCVTVEPGAGLEFAGTLCSVGFVLQGSDGFRYATSAGHCAAANHLAVGALVFAEDTTTPVGRVAYVEYLYNPLRDSVVVRLFSRTKSHGRAEVIDGPHGSFDGSTTAPFKIQQVGRGVGLSQIKDDRQGVALAATDPDIVHADIAVTPNDSGSPVFTANGKAVGWVTDISTTSLADFSTDPPAAAIGVTVIRVGPVLQRVGHSLHIRLTLVNA